MGVPRRTPLVLLDQAVTAVLSCRKKAAVRAWKEGGEVRRKLRVASVQGRRNGSSSTLGLCLVHHYHLQQDQAGHMPQISTCKCCKILSVKYPHTMLPAG